MEKKARYEIFIPFGKQEILVNIKRSNVWHLNYNLAKNTIGDIKQDVTNNTGPKKLSYKRKTLDTEKEEANLDNVV